MQKQALTEEELLLFPVRCWVRTPQIPRWYGYHILGEEDLRRQFAGTPGTLFAVPLAIALRPDESTPKE